MQAQLPMGYECSSKSSNPTQGSLTRGLRNPTQGSRSIAKYSRNLSLDCAAPRGPEAPRYSKSSDKPVVRQPKCCKS